MSFRAVWVKLENLSRLSDDEMDTQDPETNVEEDASMQDAEEAMRRLDLFWAAKSL
jgi:hypothetical protein